MEMQRWPRYFRLLANSHDAVNMFHAAFPLLKLKADDMVVDMLVQPEGSRHNKTPRCSKNSCL